MNITKKINEYWNEHDGTNFYKDELEDFIKGLLSQILKEVIDDLESNPNEDGLISPNIQHWIERKQVQLRKKYGVDR